MVNTAQAESALAYELQASKQQQQIIAEELNVDLGWEYSYFLFSYIFLVEKQLSIQVEEKEILRAEKELTATTRLPADARAYKTRVLAEGSRLAKLKSAEGDAQKIRLLGAAEATAIEAVSYNLAFFPFYVF